MRTALIGAVEGSYAALRALTEAGEEPELIGTLPAARSHRHSDYVDLRPFAVAHSLPVVDVTNVNDPCFLDVLREAQLDYLFVIGWSQICGPGLLGIPSKGTIGYHPSPLPENRGRGVIPWTILQGRDRTAGTLFWMDEGMDTGDILVQHDFAVSRCETARTLYDKHIAVLRGMLEAAVAHLRGPNPPRTPQDHQRATWCARRRPEDGLVDWSRSARDIWTLIRACGDPYPGAFTFQGDRRLTLWEADFVGVAPHCGLPGQVQAIDGDAALVQCGDGEHVRLRIAERDGEGPRAARDIVRVHERLGLNLATFMTAAQSTT